MGTKEERKVTVQLDTWADNNATLKTGDSMKFEAHGRNQLFSLPLSTKRTL